MEGLSERLRDKLAAREKPADLPSLVSVTIRLEKRLHETWQEKVIYSFSPAWLKPSSASIPSGTARPTPALSAEEPIQLGHACLLHEERHSKISARGCLYYSKTGLFLFLTQKKGLISKGRDTDEPSSCPATLLYLSTVNSHNPQRGSYPFKP